LSLVSRMNVYIYKYAHHMVYMQEVTSSSSSSCFKTQETCMEPVKGKYTDSSSSSSLKMLGSCKDVKSKVYFESCLL
jgi:hypothetical protein